MTNETSSLPPSAWVMREDERNFFLVTNRPMDPRERSYRRLERMAPSLIQMLEGGNQVFVYPRQDFDPAQLMGGSGHNFTQADLFRGRVIMEAQQMGRPVMIEPAVHRVEDRRVPSQDSMFMI